MPVNLIWLFFSFKGRIGRGAYCISALSSFVIFFLVGMSLAPQVLEQGRDDMIAFILLINVMLLWMLFATVAKRFHDIGYSAKYNFFGFVPVLGPIMFLALPFVKGEEGENEYGLPPQGLIGEKINA